ncbi:MAG: NAD(P)/FAD-dependent oxidoreductase [Candidatus Sumerlaeaceae bacterium]
MPTNFPKTAVPAAADSKVESAREPVVILGAGPAGLTAAYELLSHGQRSIVLERENQVGGLAKTVKYKGYGFDIGGHRFFTKLSRVDRLWREVLGADFIKVPRLSRIYYHGSFFHYPLKPWNAFFGLGVWNTVLVLGSYVRARLRPLPLEEYFDQYIINRFGRRLYEIFFRTYTEKVWGIPCSQIRADWAAQRIKGLSLVKAIRNAFFGSRNGDVKSLIEEFDYPRLGPGMLWERLEQRLNAGGAAVHLGREVHEISHDGLRITAVAHASTGTTEAQEKAVGAFYFSSMPLRTFVDRMRPSAPAEVIEAAHALRYRDLLTINLILEREGLFPDNWIYVHSPEVRVGRIQNFGNWSRDLVPEPHRTSIGMEYFCFEGDDLWTHTDEQLIELAKGELQQLGLADPENVLDGFVLRVKKAYPMYNGDFAHNLQVIRDYLKQFTNLQLLGRNGLHKYNNQDHSMLTAFLAVDNLMHGDEHDIWQVNSDSEYQEVQRLAPAAS